VGPEQRSTIYDVARAANVAPSTVSRAFSRPSRVNALTVQRILETAAVLGYVPNQTARGLSTGRTGNLAMVIPNIANPFFTQFIRVFHQAARDREHSVQLIDTYEDAEEEVRRVEGVLSQVDGVALVSPRMGPEKLRSVTAKGRFVVVNRKLDGLACVWVDSGPALREVFADLRRFGHEAIVYVRGPVGGYSDSIRRSLVRTLARTHHVTVTFTQPARDEKLAAAAAVDLALEVGATALLTHSDGAAVAVLSECRARGLDVPGDLSIVGHDDIEWASLVHPALTTISAPTELSGRWSADTLIDLIDGNGADTGAAAPQCSMTASYVRRDSLGPARSR
jgi:DNA-binding LacI/PurR family transcriptional regulator